MDVLKNETFLTIDDRIVDTETHHTHDQVQ